MPAVPRESLRDRRIGDMLTGHQWMVNLYVLHW